MRSPLTASSPTRVSKVAARSGERSSRAAAIRAAMSALEYRYGVARWLWPGSRSAGGTSWAGSMAWRWRAKARTTDSRCAHQSEAPFGGRVAQARAASMVIVSLPFASWWETKSASKSPARTSLKPSARRMAR